jgi:Protein of unknown function (DUF2877)
MRVAITSLSSAILDCLSHPGSLGVVHSVFDRALNIRLNGLPRIIALTFPGAGGLPYAFMLADKSILNFTACGIVPGQPVDLRVGSSLQIEAADVQFDYIAASIWNPFLSQIGGPVNTPAFLELLSWAATHVFEKANHAGLVPLLREPQALFEGHVIFGNDPDQRIAKLAAPYVTSLLMGMRQGDEAGLTKAASRLLGYGVGGTPSGDDLLVGMLAALQRSSDARAKRLQVLLSNAINHQLDEKTTSLLSLTVLRHALAGEFSEKIHEVTRQLMHPADRETLESCLNRLLLHGATSGSEMFLGICLGYMLIHDTLKGDVTQL